MANRASLVDETAEDLARVAGRLRSIVADGLVDSAELRELRQHSRTLDERRYDLARWGQVIRRVCQLVRRGETLEYTRKETRRELHTPTGRTVRVVR